MQKAEDPGTSGTTNNIEVYLPDDTKLGWGDRRVTNALFLGISLTVIILALLAYPLYLLFTKICGNKRSGPRQNKAVS